jgi:hypothetical protein
VSGPIAPPVVVGARCRRCGAPLPALAVLVRIAHDADAVLSGVPASAAGLRTRAGVRLLASLLPCFAGMCVTRAAPAGHIGPTEVWR